MSLLTITGKLRLKAQNEPPSNVVDCIFSDNLAPDCVSAEIERYDAQGYVVKKMTCHNSLYSIVFVRR